MPNDSGWRSRIADVDATGSDLVVCNGENGVTSELPSYVLGRSVRSPAERTDLPTVGAYDVLAADVAGHGDGRLDLLMPSAWTDHHNPGVCGPYMSGQVAASSRIAACRPASRRSRTGDDGGSL